MNAPNMNLAFGKIQLVVAICLRINVVVMGTDATIGGKLNLLGFGHEVTTSTEISKEENDTPMGGQTGIASADDKLSFIDITGGRTTLNGISVKESFSKQRNQSGYSPVRHLRVISEEVRQLTVKWKTPDLETSLYATVGYVVKYRLRKHIACPGNVESSKWYSIEVNATTTQVIFDGLEDYASYNISVSPRTRRLVNGVERLGRPVSIVKRTLPSAPVANLQPVQSSTRSSLTTLVFHWNRVTCENQNGPNFRYVCFLYKMVDGTQRDLIMEASVNEESFIATNLEPCNSYRFEVLPRSKDDTAPSEDVVVQTPPAPFGIVRHLSLRPDGETGNVKVDWQPPLHSSCSITGYSLTVTLQRHQSCPHKDDSSEEETVWVKGTSYVINNTLPYSTFTVSVSTHGENDNLTGPASAAVITTSKQAPASSPAVSFDSLSSTNVSLAFTWEPVPCEDMNGGFVQYAYTLEQTGSDVLIDAGNILDETENRMIFEGLDPCTNYTFKIRVDNELFQGNVSAIQGETKLSAPGEDLNLALRTDPTCATSNTACLVTTWHTPVGNRCPITSQLISLHLLDVDNCTTTFQPISSSELTVSERRRVFRGLKHNSLYRVTFVVSNAAGKVEKTIEERTAESAPTGVPQHLSVRKPIRRRSVSLSWEEPVCGLRNGYIVRYKYVLFHEGRVLKMGFTHNKWHNFTNLRSGTTYSFTVNAFTAVGFGPTWVSENDEYLYFMTR